MPDKYVIEVRKKWTNGLKEWLTIELPLGHSHRTATEMYDDLCMRFGEEFVLFLKRHTFSEVLPHRE